MFHSNVCHAKTQRRKASLATSLRLCVFACLLFVAPATQAQNIQTPFGKNRIQYHNQFEDWLYYESPNYTTYWYGLARNVGQAALQIAEQDLATVQQYLEYPLSEPIELIVFSDLTDLKQSNIGSDELFTTRNNTTKIVGNKIFTYFDGDHNHLRAQVREGTAAVILNSMLFGQNLQEIVQNAVLLNLPNWFTEGLLAFCGENWNEDLDNQLRDVVLGNRHKNFARFAKENPRLAGHAFWHYISLHFGKSTISNLLYLTRINRSVDAGFLYVLGGGEKKTMETMLAYFKNRYTEEARATKMPEKTERLTIKNKRNLPFTQVKISPDGQRLAWVTNHIGRWKVWVQDLQTDKKNAVLKGGTRDALQATDYNYPLLAWNPDNRRLAVVHEFRDVVKMTVLDAGKPSLKPEKFVFPTDYQRIFSADWANAGDLVFSAANSGFSDLFLYHTATQSSERLTQDFWDDLDARVVHLDNRTGVLFASNRTSDSLSPQRLDTILPLGRFDIFYFDLQNRNPELVRVTQTPDWDERQPVGVDSAFFSYLSAESGVFNRQVGYLVPYTAFFQKNFYLRGGEEVKSLETKQLGEWPLARALAVLPPADTVLKNLDTLKIDSVRVFPVVKRKSFVYNQTNLDRSISEQSLAKNGRLAELIFRENQPGIYLQHLDTKANGGWHMTRWRELNLRDLGLLNLPGTAPGNLPGNLLPSDSAAAKTPAAPDSLAKSKLTELRDTQPVIQPGWLFQLPDYLKPPPTQTLEKTPPPSKPNPNEPDVTVIKFKNDNTDFTQVPTDADRPNYTAPTKTGPLHFNQSRIVPYRLRFRTDFISTTMNNEPLFEGLNSYAGTPQGLALPPVGLLLKANFKDLMEDYVVEMGFRLPVTFDGAEYYLLFDNKKYRLDKRFALYRKTKTSEVADNLKVRNITLLGQYELRYPLDHFLSLRATATIREDKAVLLATDNAALDVPNLNEQRLGLRLAAVYDNTVPRELNTRFGTRAKLWVEASKRFEFNTDPTWSFKFGKGFMTVVGVDARHYFPLDKHSIFALRLSAATSFGSEKILYYLGGEEGEIFPRFNRNIPVPAGDYAFENLAPQMRGFKQNIRNGNSFALINSELRVPVLKYLFGRRPMLSSFLRNFQLVGFFDVGTAWHGASPYTGINPLNITHLYNPPTVSVTVNYFRDPLVAAYGAGVRLPLFGMFLRFDYGWGIETRVVQPGLWHFALGTDF